jgi:hypothetical protein
LELVLDSRIKVGGREGKKNVNFFDACLLSIDFMLLTLSPFFELFLFLAGPEGSGRKNFKKRTRCTILQPKTQLYWFIVSSTNRLKNVNYLGGIITL